jgi:succinoglycan biosynthesis protein ExoA
METPAPDPMARSALAIIPCLNEAERLPGLIARVLDDPGWTDPLVVIADGGSKDGGFERAQAIAATDPRVRVIRNPKRIQSAAINLAVAHFGLGRRWLARIDAHCRYPPGYVSSLIEDATRTGAVSVVVSMRSEGVDGFQRGVASAQNSWLGAGGAAHRRAPRPGFVDHGHHALMDLAAFRAAGGYDESFSHNEDAELDARLRRLGGRIWLTDRARLAYLPRGSPAALFRQYLNYGAGRARTLKRHRERPKLRQLAPLLVAPALAALAFAPVAPLLAIPALAWATSCCLAGAALALAKRDPAAVLAGPAAMTMHLGWSLGFWREALRLPRKGPALARAEAGG